LTGTIKCYCVTFILSVLREVFEHIFAREVLKKCRTQDISVKKNVTD